MFHVEHSRIKGRGAQSGQVPTRFGLAEREVDGDWRDYVAALDGPPVKLRTTVTEERPKTILTFNQSPDVPFDRSVNAYRGCEHGCVYCFARPTHAYHDLSPGLDFETRLFAKPDAAALLRKTLAKKGYSPKPIALGTNTDPYQPIERDWRITRQILEVCLETRHPVTITTKSDRVLDDADLIAAMAREDLVALPNAWPPWGNWWNWACRCIARFRPSSRRSPMNSWRPSSPTSPLWVCKASAGFPCASPTKSRRCFANGWPSTILNVRAKS